MILQDVKTFLMEKYKCHTIILYGSYAKGTQNEFSDIDVIGFTELELECQDKSMIHGKPLDAWIYNGSKMDSVDDFVHVRKCTVLLDAAEKAQGFIGKLEARINEGPQKQTRVKKTNAIDWLRKMNRRTLSDDLESCYRFHWLLTDILPIYFDIMGTWYLGSKESLEWIEQNDSEVYAVLRKIYSKEVTREHIEEMISILEKRVC